MTLLDFASLQREMTDRRGIEVDLVSKRGLRPRIGQCILAEARVL